MVDNIEWRKENEGRIQAWLLGKPFPSNYQAEPKITYAKFKNVDYNVIAEDRGLLKIF